MLKLKIYDVGHGSSILIETDKINILFDFGSKTNREFDPFERNKIYSLFTTHPHMDHISALKYLTPYKYDSFLIRNIPNELIKKLIDEAESEEDRIIYIIYKELNTEKKGLVPYERNPLNPEYNGGVEIKLFTPQQDYNDLNYYSNAMLLKYRGFKILLTGDNDENNLEELMNCESFKKEIENVDVLLAPHHGHESGYHEDFLNHVNPKITMISDKNNEKVLENVYKSNSRGFVVKGKDTQKCLTTYKNGEINIEIYGYEMTIRCEK